MLKNHREEIAECKREAGDRQNPEVKAFAAKIPRTLEEHLQLAESTNRDINGQSECAVRP